MNAPRTQTMYDFDFIPDMRTHIDDNGFPASQFGKVAGNGLACGKQR